MSPSVFRFRDELPVREDTADLRIIGQECLERLRGIPCRKPGVQCDLFLSDGVDFNRVVHHPEIVTVLDDDELPGDGGQARQNRVRINLFHDISFHKWKVPSLGFQKAGAPDVIVFVFQMFIHSVEFGVAIFRHDKDVDGFLTGVVEGHPDGSVLLFLIGDEGVHLRRGELPHGRLVGHPFIETVIRYLVHRGYRHFPADEDLLIDR